MPWGRGDQMNFATFVLLLVTFPYWSPVVGFFFIGIGGVWMICYPIACTAHMLYMRARYKKWVHWQLLYPGM
jgi:hypothetical protein